MIWTFTKRGKAAQDVAVRAYRADVRARGAGDRCTGCWRTAFRGGAAVREPAPDYSDEPIRAAEPAVGLRPGGAGHACPAGPTRAGAALPWPNARRCATAIAGSATARRCAAGRATKGRHRRAAAAACTMPAGAQPAGDAGAVRRGVCAAGGRRRADRAERRLARPSYQPGPLAQQHAQLLERADGGAPNCGACHAAASQNVAGWAASLVVAHDDRPTQSQLCMNCHAKTIPKELALAAHNLPAECLEPHCRNARGSGQSTASSDSHQQQPNPINSSDPFIACATLAIANITARWLDLTAMDDAACQSCHQQRLPEFCGGPSGFWHLAVRAADADCVQSCVASGQAFWREEAGV